MVIERADKRKTYSKQPLTGVLVSKGPTNPNKITDHDVLELSSKLGKRLEYVAFEMWCGKKVDQDYLTEIEQSSNSVRERLQPLTKKTYQKNADIIPLYQSLTKPSQIPFIGNEIDFPTWLPMDTLFRTLDATHDTRFLEVFATLYEEYPKSGLIDRRIKHLTEAALAASRLTLQKSPFQGNIYRNGWIGNAFQWDGVLFPTSVKPNGHLPTLTQENPYSVIEIKTDFRTPHITGFNNPLDRNIEPRFIGELQVKLAKLLLDHQDKANLPVTAYFVFLRGLRDHVIHPIRINRAFLTSWLNGVQNNLRTTGYSEEDTDRMINLTLIIEDVIHNIDENGDPSREVNIPIVPIPNGKAVALF